MNLHDECEYFMCLDKIAEHYGFEHQVFEKLPEELNELLTAIKDCAEGKDSWEHVLEEAADVSVMLSQFAILIDEADRRKFSDTQLKKVKRECSRIKMKRIQYETLGIRTRT